MKGNAEVGLYTEPSVADSLASDNPQQRQPQDSDIKGLFSPSPTPTYEQNQNFCFT